MIGVALMVSDLTLQTFLKMGHSYQYLESHPLWPVVQGVVASLVENQDLTLTTADEYVVGFLVSQTAGENLLLIDWLKITSKDEFYDLVLPQCKAPDWHGRSLDALNDSWVTGRVNKVDPPYSFWFLNGVVIDSKLSEFRAAVEEIAADSIAENGGQIHRVEQKR